MTKKEKLLKRYLETHTLTDYEAYISCPEDAKSEPANKKPKKPKESDSEEILSENERG